MERQDEKDKDETISFLCLKNERFNRKKEIGDILALKRKEVRVKAKHRQRVYTFILVLVVLAVLLFILFCCMM